MKCSKRKTFYYLSSYYRFCIPTFNILIIIGELGFYYSSFVFSWLQNNIYNKRDRTSHSIYI